MPSQSFGIIFPHEINPFHVAHVYRKDPALQLAALKKAGCMTVFKDEGLSGANTKRPAFTRCLKALRPGDTLIVWKLDRLGRSPRALIPLLSLVVKRRFTPAYTHILCAGVDRHEEAQRPQAPVGLVDQSWAYSITHLLGKTVKAGRGAGSMAISPLSEALRRHKDQLGFSYEIVGVSVKNLHAPSVGAGGVCLLWMCGAG